MSRRDHLGSVSTKSPPVSHRANVRAAFDNDDNLTRVSTRRERIASTLTRVSSLGARVFELGVALVRARVRLRRRRRRRARDAHDTVSRGVRLVVVVHLLAPTSRSASRHERAGVLGISDGGGRRARARVTTTRDARTRDRGRRAEASIRGETTTSKTRSRAARRGVRSGIVSFSRGVGYAATRTGTREE